MDAKAFFAVLVAFTTMFSPGTGRVIHRGCEFKTISSAIAAEFVIDVKQILHNSQKILSCCTWRNVEIMQCSGCWKYDVPRSGRFIYSISLFSAGNAVVAFLRRWECFADHKNVVHAVGDFFRAAFSAAFPRRRRFGNWEKFESMFASSFSLANARSSSSSDCRLKAIHLHDKRAESRLAQRESAEEAKEENRTR